MDEHKNSEEIEGRKILKPWADKHGIVNVKPLSCYDIERMEDNDPAAPNRGI